MPRIELIDVPMFGPNDPIHWTVDNIPLKNLMRRQVLINLALDNIIEQITDAVGTQNTISNRLNQSIEADGSLKTQAVDDSMHSIESHADTASYVRMQKSESDKLALVDSEATDVELNVANDDSFVSFPNGVVNIRNSNTITWTVEAPNVVKAHMIFSSDAAHKHYYTQVPVHAVVESPDFLNYKANSLSTEYMEGSLRVYINGVRINSVASDATTEEIEEAKVLVPGALVDYPWTAMYFVPDHENGTFALSSAISEDDVIRVDYDIKLT